VEGIILNEAFRRGLKAYLERPGTHAGFDERMAHLASVQPGRSFGRNDINKRS
jgi:hypothetical protein